MKKVIGILMVSFFLTIAFGSCTPQTINEDENTEFQTDKDSTGTFENPDGQDDDDDDVY